MDVCRRLGSHWDCSEEGSGQDPHLHTQSLWVQDAVREKRVFLDKVPGADNPADMYTKHLDAQTLIKHMKRTGMEARGGRSQVAPDLVRSAGKQDVIEAGEQVDSLEIDVESDGELERECAHEEKDLSQLPRGTPQRRGGSRVSVDQVRSRDVRVKQV